VRPKVPSQIISGSEFVRTLCRRGASSVCATMLRASQEKSALQSHSSLTKLVRIGKSRFGSNGRGSAAYDEREQTLKPTAHEQDGFLLQDKPLDRAGRDQPGRSETLDAALLRPAASTARCVVDRDLSRLQDDSSIYAKKVKLAEAVISSARPATSGFAGCRSLAKPG